MRKPIAFALVAALVAGLPLIPVNQISARALQATSGGKQILDFGPEELQQVSYWRGTSASAPLVVFVHGGGWQRGDMQATDDSAKLSHWRELGYAVASVNYRLVPAATVEQQAADIAAAIALLHSQADQLEFDPTRIALVGHSAGAHLAALVGTDPQWLEAQGLSLAVLDGVLPLDGAAYDVTSQISDAGRFLRRTYRQAFGEDRERHRRLSPVAHAGSPNAPEFLILHVERDDARSQSAALAAALRNAGTPVEVQEFEGRGLRGHMEINRRMGEPDYPATQVVDRWLARIFN